MTKGDSSRVQSSQVWPRKHFIPNMLCMNLTAPQTQGPRRQRHVVRRICRSCAVGSRPFAECRPVSRWLYHGLKHLWQRWYWIGPKEISFHQGLEMTRRAAKERFGRLFNLHRGTLYRPLPEPGHSPLVTTSKRQLYVFSPSESYLWLRWWTSLDIAHLNKLILYLACSQNS